MRSVTIDQAMAQQALDAALQEFPQFAGFGPRLSWRPLFQGGAFVVEYGVHPPRDAAGIWDFQNAVVKGYKRLAGLR